MKSLRRIASAINCTSSKIWNRLDAFTELAVGVALIVGANGFALAYIPITFLAVPVASAGTLVGTFVFANALSRQKKQHISEEVQSMLETEKLKQELNDTNEEVLHLRTENDHLKRQGMNAIEINPELKLTFLSMKYNKWDFCEEVIEQSPGKHGWIDDNPYEVKYQGIYYIEGKIDYEIDLSKLRVAQEGNTLIFCGEIKPNSTPRMTDVEEIVLKQERRTTWDFDKGKFKNRGDKIETVITDKIGESHIDSPAHQAHRNRLRESLKKSDADYVKNFQKLAQMYLENIFKMTGMRIRFDENRKGDLSLSDFIDRRNTEVRLAHSEGSAIV